MILQLKTKNNYFLTLLRLCSERILYLIIFLIPLVAVAQNSTTTIYVNNEVIIYGINQIQINKSSANDTHKETIYITEETPFHADASLVASLSYIQKKETSLKNSVVKTIPSKKIVAAKAINTTHNSKQSQFKYQKNTIPFKADIMFKNGITLVVSASNSPIVLKTKNNAIPYQTRINSIDLAVTVEVKKTTYTSLFQNRNTLKEGIVTYQRPPPFLLVKKTPIIIQYRCS
jgi:hypothetical protein